VGSLGPPGIRFQSGEAQRCCQDDKQLEQVREVRRARHEPDQRGHRCDREQGGQVAARPEA
jgi:hypothetical protein